METGGEPDNGPSVAHLRAAILRLVSQRGPGGSICPSEAARTVGGEGWRELMGPIRAAARGLAREGLVEVTQRGAALDPAGDWRGPIRIRVKRR